MSSIQACCVCHVAQQSNMTSIEPNWEARTLEHGTSLGATNGYDKTCCVTIFAAAQENGTLRIVKGVTVLPQGVARSSCAPSSNTWFLSTFPADKMITTDTDTQRKQWKSSCQTSTNLLNTCCLACLVIKLTECLLDAKKRKHWTIRRLA